MNCAARNIARKQTHNYLHCRQQFKLLEFILAPWLVASAPTMPEVAPNHLNSAVTIAAYTVTMADDRYPLGFLTICLGLAAIQCITNCLLGSVPKSEYLHDHVSCTNQMTQFTPPDGPENHLWVTIFLEQPDCYLLMVFGNSVAVEIQICWSIPRLGVRAPHRGHCAYSIPLLGRKGQLTRPPQ